MQYVFWPHRVYFEPEALNYPLGKELYGMFQRSKVNLHYTTTHNRVTGISGNSPTEKFDQAKKTLVIGVRRTLSFQSCKPSAHYQLPLVTGCPGRCHYCYLHTSLGRTPYLRVYVNIAEILEAAREYLKKMSPEIVYFEGSAVSDPLFAEPFTQAISSAVKFFAGEERGRFRLVSKLAAVEPFLGLNHRGHTHFRVSINHPEIIRRYEKGTSSLKKRITSLKKIMEAKYPAGIMIAPIFLEGDWKKDYQALFELLSEEMPAKTPLTFELITHRFTRRARSNILKYFPHTELSMKEEQRRFKYGQFGYGKFVYPKEEWEEARSYFTSLVQNYFPDGKIEYFV